MGPLNLLLESNEMEIEGVDSELWCLHIAVRGDLGSPEDRKSYLCLLVLKQNHGRLVETYS